MVASDLDGTLFSSERQVADRTADTLRRVAATGVMVVAATGRSHWTAIPRLSPVGAFRWAVCSNGSALFDFERMAVVERQLLDHEASAAIAELPRLLPGVGLAWEHAAGIDRDDVFVAQRRRNGAVFEEPAVAFDAGLELNKVLVGHDDLEHDELLDAVRPHVPPALEISSSGASFIEITAPGVDKAAMLARLVARLGIDATDVVAFGDQHNDLAMLRWAGRGYAMANAHPTVFDATPLRAPHHDDHGVAQILDLLFPIDGTLVS
ncbi:MAG: HAD-IIB family hydrolase [Acidimicrobiales bacterium]